MLSASESHPCELLMDVTKQRSLRVIAQASQKVRLQLLNLELHSKHELCLLNGLIFEPRVRVCRVQTVKQRMRIWKRLRKLIYFDQMVMHIQGIQIRKMKATPTLPVMHPLMSVTNLQIRYKITLCCLWLKNMNYVKKRATASARIELCTHEYVRSFQYFCIQSAWYWHYSCGLDVLKSDCYAPETLLPNLQSQMPYCKKLHAWNVHCLWCDNFQGFLHKTKCCHVSVTWFTSHTKSTVWFSCHKLQPFQSAYNFEFVKSQNFDCVLLNRRSAFAQDIKNSHQDILLYSSIT